jgi:hypothetical protein
MMFEQSLIGVQFEVPNNHTTSNIELRSKEYEVQVNLINNQEDNLLFLNLLLVIFRAWICLFLWKTERT